MSYAMGATCEHAIPWVQPVLVKVFNSLVYPFLPFLYVSPHMVMLLVLSLQQIPKSPLYGGYCILTKACYSLLTNRDAKESDVEPAVCTGSDNRALKWALLEDLRKENWQFK